MEDIQSIIRMEKRKKRGFGSTETMKDYVHSGLKMVNKKKKGFIKIPKGLVFGPIGIRMGKSSVKDTVKME